MHGYNINELDGCRVPPSLWCEQRSISSNNSSNNTVVLQQRHVRNSVAADAPDAMLRVIQLSQLAGYRKWEYTVNPSDRSVSAKAFTRQFAVYSFGIVQYIVLLRFCFRKNHDNKKYRNYVQYFYHIRVD